MTTPTKPSFLRLFATGFAFGAACLLGVQVVQAGPESIVAAAHAATR